MNVYSYKLNNPRREEAEVFTEMRGLVFRLLTSAATLSFALRWKWQRD